MSTTAPISSHDHAVRRRLRRGQVLHERRMPLAGPLPWLAFLERQCNARHGFRAAGAARVMEIGGVQPRGAVAAQHQFECAQQAALAAVVLADERGAGVEPHGRGTDCAQMLDVQFAEEHDGGPIVCPIM